MPKIGPRKAPFSPRTHTAERSTTQASPQDAADHPWIVAIDSYYPPAALYCTGEIISPTKVITAAGCVAPPRFPGRTEVFAGRDDPGDDTVGFVDGVASVWTAPNFTVSGMYPQPGSNLAVLTLTLPLPSVYTPIPLSAQGDESPYALGTTGYTLSYGSNIDTPGWGLIELPVTVIDDGSSCAPWSIYRASEETCASYPGSGGIGPTAPRNLGDPLVINGTLAGVGDYLNGDDENPFLPYERMSVFHDAVTADLARPDPGTQDWTGDGISDVLGEAAHGQLTDYQGLGAYPGSSQGFVGQTLIDQTNWNADPRLLRVTNWDYDGTEGLLAVNPSGVLTLYPSTPTRGIDYAHAAQVGTGWNTFSTIVATNNFTGDGRPDLLAVRPDGTLWLYERTGNGWVNGGGVEIGNGFNQFTDLMAFRWTDTGHIGLLGVTPTGDLKFYGTDGGGHWVNGGGVVIGAGFAGLRTVFSTGSFGGTDTGSIMTVDNAGNLKVYLATGVGGWSDGNGIEIGVGFQTLKAVF